MKLVSCGGPALGRTIEETRSKDLVSGNPGKGFEKTMDRERAQKQIMEAAFEAFRKKGLHFTMSDLAAEVGMSKKTLYQLFEDKEDLLLQVADYSFDAIKRSEAEVMGDESLDTVEKLRALMAAMPDIYQSVDLRKLYELEQRHPQVYARVQERLESDWESTIALLRKGMEEGKIRPCSIPLFKAMFEATLERFFREDVLTKAQLSYQEGLQQVVDILIDGITVKEES